MATASLASEYLSVGAAQDQFATFPDELKALPRWVRWRSALRNGKPTKIPIQINGTPASTRSPSTWVYYETAVAADHGNGIGCVISPPYVGIDLDKCRNPETGFTETWAEAIIKELDSYTELSPSGCGYHIWVKGKLGDINRRGRVEMYSEGRYFTVTGKRIDGTPLTIEERDLTSLQARLAAGTLEPGCKAKPLAKKQNATVVSQKPTDRKQDLVAGSWQELYSSQSEADLALCMMLAQDFHGDTAKIDATFRNSGLYREKWDDQHGAQTYGQGTISKAIELWREDVGPQTPDEGSPAPYPAEIIDGDLIGDLSRALTDGTTIPPAFVRQNIKTVLGAILTGSVGFPNHEDLHLRQYSINVSLHPQSGKGQSWKRTAEYRTGVLNSLLGYRDSSSGGDRSVKTGVMIVEGGQFSSGEKLATLFEQNSRILGRFDEMSELFQKFRTLASTLEDKFTSLYDREVISHGSLTHGEHESMNSQLSYVGDFVADRFHFTFLGRGSAGSGFLSRNVLTYCDKTAVHGKDWAALDTARIERIIRRIEERIGTLQQQVKFTPLEDDEARSLRLGLFAWLEEQPPRYTGRLNDHFKRDLLFCALFSDGPEMRITAELTRRSIAWVKRQLEDRIKLWPDDTGNLGEIMERRILDAIGKHRLDQYDTRGIAGLTDREIAKLANVHKPGSGGYETFNRSKRALVASRMLHEVGHTRRGTPVYDGMAT